jgi:hypothetical protein
MNLVDMIRQTRKEYRTSMNKIAAIKLVRKLSGRGLKEAKDFFDWMDVNGDGLSALRLAGHWCEEHWQDNEICGCPKGVEIAADERQIIAVSMEASGGEPASAMRPATGTTSQAPVPVLSESDFTPSGLPTMAAMIRLNVNCRCGVPNCNNEYHALATYLSKNPDAWKLWNAALDRYIEEQQQL